MDPPSILHPRRLDQRASRRLYRRIRGYGGGYRIRSVHRSDEAVSIQSRGGELRLGVCQFNPRRRRGTEDQADSGGCEGFTWIGFVA